MFLHCSSHLFTLRTVQCPRCLFSCPFIPFRIDVSTSFCLEECIFHPFSMEESSRTCLQWRKESEEKTTPAPWWGKSQTFQYKEERRRTWLHLSCHLVPSAPCVSLSSHSILIQPPFQSALCTLLHPCFPSHCICCYFGTEDALNVL